MAELPTRIAMVSMHTSPAQQAGTGDAGGMNVAVLATARELVGRGIEVELLTRAETAPAMTELEPGITLCELPAGDPGPLDREGLALASDEFGEAVATLAGRGRPRYDIIHSHYWLSGIATLPVALELGVPFVQSFHTLAAMKARDLGASASANAEPLIAQSSVSGSLDARFDVPNAVDVARRAPSEQYLASQSSAIIAASAAEATCLIDDVRAPADKVWVVPPGVDVDLFRPNRADAESRVRDELAIGPGRPVLVVAGRVQPLKDQELAIRILAEMHAMHGWSPVLVVAGRATPGDEDYERRLHVVATDLGVADEVRFVGALSHTELADLFAAASLTLATSHSETFGLVALESAASGTPVVGFRASGLRESVAHGRSGVLVDSRDPREWARVITRLLDDPPVLSRLSNSAREHALDFTWAASATALLGVYSSLL